MYLKTLDQIKRSVWNNVGFEPKNIHVISKEWDYKFTATLDDVELWEEIYFLPGTIAVYAAYNPKIEYYLIVHNLFLSSKFGIEEFYGAGANKQTYDRAKELGVILPTVNRWINEKESWLYQTLD